MKITSIDAVRLTTLPHELKTAPRRESWSGTAEVANPMSRYPHRKTHRSKWLPPWGDTWCRVTLGNGTTGCGQTSNGRITAALIDDHPGPRLAGENVMAQDRLADMLFRLTTPFSAARLGSYAVSAVGLALCDARAKLLERPVYELAAAQSCRTVALNRETSRLVRH